MPTALGDCTLRAAVQEAAASGGPRVIELPAGVFGLRAGDPHEDASVDGDLDIAGTLEVRGAGADATSISGGRQSRLFQVLSGGSLTLRALALVDGSSSDGRAGAVDNAGNLVIEDARLEGNTATVAGAIRSSGTLEVRRSLFTDDRAEGGDGGAVQVLRGKATFEDSVFERDRSKGNGGALLVSDGTVSVARTRFSLNEAYAGAALAALGGTTTVEASTFDQDRAFLGGAIVVRQADGRSALTVRDATFDHNVATGPGLGGGAIAVVDGHVQVDASTFSANSASVAAGGGVSLSTGSVAIVDSTFDHDVATGAGDAVSVGAARPRKRALPYDLSIDWSTLVARDAPGHRRRQARHQGRPGHHHRLHRALERAGRCLRGRDTEVRRRQHRR